MIQLHMKQAIHYQKTDNTAITRAIAMINFLEKSLSHSSFMQIGVLVAEIKKKLFNKILPRFQSILRY